ncbi:putative sulfite reductase hemoprotein subunit [Candidatus Zinderia insecticola CARI]|uniref:Putative sulfite reductase hemoprotein subunit n=1 Tax=Zinderia insecticola (strain CARI) TaxID=871271 RepID=E0TIX7_ZINIC|nr:putative sulfite reductase hemoprotein subunit [Candidatus Zinderia insecticola CARI]
MYIYDKYDRLLIQERIFQYIDQYKRYKEKEIDKNIFRSIRLKNGIYKQKNLYMIRIAIPYGLLSSKQIKILYKISKKYDKGYGHFTTRQNIQFNWIKLNKTIKILKYLSSCNMHCIQTSGNCIRNITSDEYSGIRKNEIVDCRIFAEIIRQWSTFHPEFSNLPRKFKIAISNNKNDKAVILIHDIGLKIIKKNSKLGFRIFVGGGLGRIPILAKLICNFLPYKYILSYLDIILRIYNNYSIRNNIYKSRIKILVKNIGIKKFSNLIKKEWKKNINKKLIIINKEYKKIFKYFNKKTKINIKINNIIHKNKKNNLFNLWINKNVIYKHKNKNYCIVNLPLKSYNLPTGNITSKQLFLLYILSKKYNKSEIRVTHEQNLLFTYVKIKNLYNIWKKINIFKLFSLNNNLLTDNICCPGDNFCSLANTSSIFLNRLIYKNFNNNIVQNKINKIKINISGCINSCAHHHIANIGILGLKKKNKEFYQISLGGNYGTFTKFGNILGPSFSKKNIILVINKILQLFLKKKKKYNYFKKYINSININYIKKNIY